MSRFSRMHEKAHRQRQYLPELRADGKSRQLCTARATIGAQGVISSVCERALRRSAPFGAAGVIWGSPHLRPARGRVACLVSLGQLGVGARLTPQCPPQVPSRGRKAWRISLACRGARRRWLQGGLAPSGMPAQPPCQWTLASLRRTWPGPSTAHSVAGAGTGGPLRRAPTPAWQSRAGKPAVAPARAPCRVAAPTPFSLGLTAVRTPGGSDVAAAKRAGSRRAGPPAPTWLRCWRLQSTAHRQALRAASALRPRWRSTTVCRRCQAARQACRHALGAGRRAPG